ncbi:MAG: pyridoxal phosphate-dependent aminotransferase [Spirochaetota bacterium]|nr:pyridoxal phosphate-dependent aminotransferase [Spirochaetota bacterium]
MPISTKISESMQKSSWIRKMFEEGAMLKAKYGVENVFDFSLGNPDIDPPQKFFSILKDISSKKIKGIHGYMPNPGFPDVRESIAKRVKADHGIDIKGEQIIMTCGAAGGLNVALKTILNSGERVIVPKPYFAEYGFYIDNHGGEIIPVDTKSDFSLDIGIIENAIDDNVRAILINSPNNPSGRVYTEEDIIALSGLLAKNAEKGRIIYLISDEPYREIVYDGVTVPSILKHCKNSIVATSFSKTFSIPGERIGYLAINPECKDVDMLLAGFILCNRILGFVNAPAVIQRVVAELNDVTVDAEIYKRRRDILMDGLSSAGYDFIKPDGSFYLFCKSPIDDDVEFVRHLQKYNVLVVPGSGFGTPGYFRISYCISEDVIKRAIPKFKEAIESL